MGLIDLKDKMCDEYTEKTTRLSNQLSNIHKMTRGPYNELRNSLYDLKSKATTPINLLNSKLNSLESSMKAQVPDLLNNRQDLEVLMRKCTPFGDLMNGRGSLTDAIKSVVGATSDMLLGVVDDAADSLMKNVEEYASGKAMAALDTLFGEVKIPDVLGGLDPLINCLDGMCPGSRTSGIVDKINNIQNEIGFDDEGKFDSAAIMNKVGMPSDKQTNLTSINSLISKTASDAQSSASNQVNTLFKTIKKEAKAPFKGKLSSFF